MAVAEHGESFDSWLAGRLDSAGTDGEVFSGYISGTLDSLDGATSSEVEESLLEILQSCLEDEALCLSICEDIQKHWVQEAARRQAVVKGQELIISASDMKAPPVKETCSTVKDYAEGMRSKVTLSSEEKRKLLEQYGCESDEEDFSTNSEERITGAFVNQNTSVSSEAQKLHRELLKANHEAKLDRDRKDKEMQKQRVLERKEKEKKRTQKQEKRR